MWLVISSDERGPNPNPNPNPIPNPNPNPECLGSWPSKVLVDSLIDSLIDSLSLSFRQVSLFPASLSLSGKSPSLTCASPAGSALAVASGRAWRDRRSSRWRWRRRSSPHRTTRASSAHHDPSRCMRAAARAHRGGRPSRRCNGTRRGEVGRRRGRSMGQQSQCSHCSSPTPKEQRAKGVHKAAFRRRKI